METNETNPFAVFRTAAEIFGYTWKHEGPAALRQFLKMGDFQREHLESALVELDAVGVLKAAKIVAEFASRAPQLAEVCPHEAGTTNARAWHQSHGPGGWEHHKQELKRRARQPTLRRYGLM